MSGPSDSKSLLDGIAKLLSQGVSGTATAPKPRLDDEKFVIVPKPADALSPAPSSSVLDTDDKKSESKSRSKLSPEQSVALFNLMLAEGESGLESTRRWKRSQTITASTAIPDPTAGTGWLLQAPINLLQGIGDENRLGPRVFLHKVNWRERIRCSITSSTAVSQQWASPPVIRHILLLDRMPNCGTPDGFAVGTGSITAVLQGSSTVVGEQPSNMPFNLITHGYRYRILRDRLIHLKPTSYMFVTGYQGYSFQQAHAFDVEINEPSFYDTSATSDVMKNQFISIYFQDTKDSSGSITNVLEVTNSCDTHFADRNE